MILYTPALMQIGSQRAIHEIPDRLKDIPTSPNPRFFDMVEYFFHRACQIAEDKLVEDMKTKMPLEDKKKKVKGILMGMQPCDHIIEINFPVRRDSGDYEMITGYRAQHSTHRTPCKGALPRWLQMQQRGHQTKICLTHCGSLTSWARHAAAGPNGTVTSSGRKSDVHVGGFSVDNGPDVAIDSPEPLYLDYDSDIIPATP
ncbi:glutamate dehydrogenase [Homalodisca vitripennis]|nr:glutamate dehydrogenase [Homalodisca vitripennis]